MRSIVIVTRVVITIIVCIIVVIINIIIIGKQWQKSRSEME